MSWVKISFCFCILNLFSLLGSTQSWAIDYYSCEMTFGLGCGGRPEVRSFAARTLETGLRLQAYIIKDSQEDGYQCKIKAGPCTLKQWAAPASPENGLVECEVAPFPTPAYTQCGYGPGREYYGYGRTSDEAQKKALDIAAGRSTCREYYQVGSCNSLDFSVE